MKLNYTPKICYEIFFSKKDADTIFKEAAAQNMTGQGYAWIVTEQVKTVQKMLKKLKIIFCFQALYSSYIPNGALVLQLTSSSDEEAHIHDSL